MKKSILLRTFCAALILMGLVTAQGLIAQNDVQTQKEKKIVIIKKSLDADGNEVIEKTIRTGADAEGFDWTTEHPDAGKVIVKRIECKEGAGDKKVFIVKGEGDEDLKLEFDVDVEFEEADENHQKQIRIIQMSTDGENDFEWQGEGELPENIKLKLKEKGIHFDQLKEGKSNVFNSLPKAFLGVTMEKKVEVHNDNGVETSSESGTSDKGALISSVLKNSAAEEAGLLAGDIIITLDAEKISNFNELGDFISNKAPGEEVLIQYLREGEMKETSAILKEYSGTMKERHKRIEVHVLCDEDDEGNKEMVIDIPPALENRSDSRIQIDRLEVIGFKAFPNPSNGTFTLEFEATAVPTFLTITDIQGKRVYSSAQPEFDGNFKEVISLDDAASGALLLTIRQGNKIFTKQLMLN